MLSQERFLDSAKTSNVWCKEVAAPPSKFPLFAEMEPYFFSCLLAMASGWITFQDDWSIHLLETVTAFRQLEEWMEHMPSEEFDYPHHITYWKLVINVWKSKLVWEESYCCRWQFAKTRILSREFRQKEQKENMQDRLCCLSTIFLN